jgi:hypothetical protein
MDFGVGEERAQMAELFFTDFIGRAEWSVFYFFEHPQRVESAQPAGESEESAS